MVENVSFRNNNDRPLSGRIYHSGSGGGTGVIFSHGLFSSKDGYKITRFADTIAGAGYRLLAFDFSFAGESGGSIADLSVLQEVEDLRSAAAYFTGLGMQRIHFVGSSMGAAVSILYLSERPAEAVSFAGIATPADLKGLITGNTAIHDPGALPEHGFTEIQGIAVGNGFFREIAAIDMGKAISRIEVPLLAIHGGMDSVVPPVNVDMLEKGVRGVFRKLVIADGDHNLVRDSDIGAIGAALVSWFKEIDRNAPPGRG